jgi:hypothetical protein
MTMLEEKKFEVRSLGLPRQKEMDSTPLQCLWLRTLARLFVINTVYLGVLRLLSIKSSNFKLHGTDTRWSCQASSVSNSFDCWQVTEASHHSFVPS